MTKTIIKPSFDFGRGHLQPALFYVSHLSMKPDQHDLMKFLQGEREAAQTLVARYSSPLYNHACYLLGGDHGLAEDMVQETFLRLWQNAQKLCDNSEALYLRAWLFRTLRNLALDHLRHNHPQTQDELPEQIEPSPDAVITIEHAERAQYAMRRIDALPERQKSALLMSHFEGMKNPEIARIMDCSIEAIENLLARARRQLRNQADQKIGDML